MSNEGGGNRKIYLAIILLLLIVATVVIVLISNSYKQKNSALADEKDQVEINVAELKTELKSLRSQYDDMYLSLNDSMALIMSERDSTVLGLMSELEEMTNKAYWADSERIKWKEKTEELEILLAGYQDKVTQLENDKAMLEQEYAAVSEELAVEQEKVAKLTEDNEILYDLGSRLKLENVYASGIKFKSNGTEKETNKIKKLEQIKVSFATGENDIISAGNIQIMLRLINPQGNTVAVESMGSGQFKNKQTNEDMLYTKSIDLDYQNENKNVAIYWSQNIYEEGLYTAQLYQNGYLIGETYFELK